MIPPTPVIAALVKAYWKPVALVVAVGGAWWAVTSWRDNLIETADAAGYARAEEHYKGLVTAANARVAAQQVQIDQMNLNIGHMAAQRAQGISLSIAPHSERIEREVSTDPRYRQCAVSDGVRDDLNAARAAVDQRVAASNPQADRR